MVSSCCYFYYEDKEVGEKEEALILYKALC